ncbi:MAG TPA: hypothetical protein VHT52_19215 [Stellaceae bacterium]|nr:hypothetical protein [Stellaceae bacterium]
MDQPRARLLALHVAFHPRASVGAERSAERRGIGRAELRKLLTDAAHDTGDLPVLRPHRKRAVLAPQLRRPVAHRGDELLQMVALEVGQHAARLHLLRQLYLLRRRHRAAQIEVLIELLRRALRTRSLALAWLR